MNVLIVGASSFVGAYQVEQLLANTNMGGGSRYW